MQDTIDFSAVLGFDWDDGNLKKNEIKHGVTARECEEAFLNQPILRRDETHSQIEDRYIAFGETNRARKLFIVFTVREGHIRIISSRDQDRKERFWYEQTIANATI